MKKAALRSIIFLYIFFLSGFISETYAQWAIMKSDADSAVKAGIRNIYNLQFPEANLCFDKVKKLYPQHPSGYFLDAMVDWWKMKTNPRVNQLDEQFLRKCDTVIYICDVLLEKNPNDIVGLFFKGGIIGYRARYYSENQSWVKAAADGKTALDIVMKCWDIAPSNKDVLLGVGLYHYFAEALPEKFPVIKPLMMFMPAGDKVSGIAELQLAGQKAVYSATEAKVALMQIYYQFENNYYLCMKVAADLFEQYPQNSMFQRYLGRCYVQLGYLAQAEELWRDVLLRCMDKKSGYDNYSAREAMYYIAVALMEKNDYQMALKYFYKCDEFSRQLDEDPSGFMVKLNLKAGQIYDLIGKRDLAIMQYKKVLSWENYQDSHEKSSQYLKEAYKR